MDKAKQQSVKPQQAPAPEQKPLEKDAERESGFAPVSRRLAGGSGSAADRSRNANFLQRSVGNSRAGAMLSGEDRDEVSPVHRKASGPAAWPEQGAVIPKPASVRDAMNGLGQPLPDSARAQLEPRFGRDLGDVRVHTGAAAQRASRDLDAQAFTSGKDIYFAEGQYRPGTAGGDHLLAHELAHTVQQRGSPTKGIQGSMSLSKPGDASEQEAEQTANRVSSGHTAPPITQSAPGNASRVARAPAAPASSASPARPPVAVDPAAPAEPVSIFGTPQFTPSQAWRDYIAAAGNAGAVVPVQFGSLASGPIQVRQKEDGFETKGTNTIPFNHPALPSGMEGFSPVLKVEIDKGAIGGYATIAAAKGAGNTKAITNWMKDHATEMGWLGMDVNQMPTPVNTLKNGVFRFQVEGFSFKLAGFISGTGTFGLENQQVTFNAKATVSVKGLTEAELELSRTPEGTLSGKVDVPVSIAKFSGNLTATYNNGEVGVEGKAGYTDEKFSGEVNLLVTDAATARNVALEHLPPEAVQAAGPQPQAQGKKPREGERAVAGWGTLNFAFNEWLTGAATVIVDNEGHITVIGEIKPQAEVELFPQRDFIHPIFKLEVRAGYGIPVVGQIFLFANVGMEALAKLGPGKLYNIKVAGRYSTDPKIFNEFTIEGSLNISAFAGLRLRAEGGAGLTVLGHDIKAGVGLNALAGVRGYVEATPKIGYRETAEPAQGRKGEFFLHGHMELAAQPFLGLSGDLFVELDSPWWSPAPDKKWTWPIGNLEYPLPGEFGIGADVDYVIGSNKMPEIQFGKVDFNKDKFMTDLINDHVPPKSKGDQEKKGEWKEGETGAGQPAPQLADSQGAPGPGAPAAGQQKPGDKKPGQPGVGQQPKPGEGKAPDPGLDQKWLKGMEALQGLAQKSKRDPYDQAEIDSALAGLKGQHGFTELRAEHEAEDWQVHAAMAKKGTVKVEAEPTPRLPRSDGKWSGVEGESHWISSNPAVIRIVGKGKGVPFKSQFPVFHQWARATVRIEMSGEQDDFAAADTQLAKKWAKDDPDTYLYRGEPNASAVKRWRQSNKYTWHHHQGGTTMQLIPTALHANVPHTGGASGARD